MATDRAYTVPHRNATEAELYTIIHPMARQQFREEHHVKFRSFEGECAAPSRLQKNNEDRKKKLESTKLYEIAQLRREYPKAANT